MALAFADKDALLVAIKTGLVSKEVAAGSARVGFGANQLVVVEPDKAVPAGVLQKLRAAGVSEAAMPAGSRAIRCWAEALVPVAIGVGKLPALCLFLTEKRALVIALRDLLIERKVLDRSSFAHLVT